MSKLKLEVGKRYVDGHGDTFRVLADRREYGYKGDMKFIAVAEGCGVIKFFFEDGRDGGSPGVPNRGDFIREITPYDDWPIDAPVIVHNEGNSPEDFQKRHWAGVRGGWPSAWMRGRTSHTATNEGDWATWDYAKLAEDVK